MALDLGTQDRRDRDLRCRRRFATPGKTLPRGKFGKGLRQNARDRERTAIAGIVIGLPRNMDGSEGPRAQASRAYAKNLAAALELPVLLWDERWSTASAEAALIGQDMSRAKRATGSTATRRQ